MTEIGWGRYCAEFAAGHVKELTGRDVWKEIGPCPRNAREAAEFYRRLGVRSLRDAVSKLLGEPIKPCFAMRGDLVLVMSGAVPALGIVRGELIECLDNFLPIARAECCWELSPYRKPKD